MLRVLDDEPVNGARVVERSLRPVRHVRLVWGDDYQGACAVIERLCHLWGGVADLLVPVSRDGQCAAAYRRLLIGVDADFLTLAPGMDFRPDWLSGTGLDVGRPREFPVALIAAVHPPEHYRPVQNTVPPDGPWHLGYTVSLGRFPEAPAADVLDGVRARPDFRHDEVLRLETDDSIATGSAEPSLDDLIVRLRSGPPISFSVIGLDVPRLGHTTYATDGWLVEQAAYVRQTGGDVVVLYTPESVDDLALLWNLRAQHGWPAGLPLGYPIRSLPTDAAAIAALAEELHATVVGRELGGLFAGTAPVLTSASLAPELLEALAAALEERVGGFCDHATPADLLTPAPSPARTTNDELIFNNGAALVRTRAPGDEEWLRVAERLPGEPPLSLTVRMKGTAIPASATLRGKLHVGPRYSGGRALTVAGRDEYRQVVWPQKWTMLQAVAQDHGLEVSASPPGATALALIAAVGDLRATEWLASRPLLDRLYDKAAATGMEWFKKRATEISRRVDEVREDPKAADEELVRAITELHVSHDADTQATLTFGELKQVLGNKTDAATAWLEWAEQRRLLIRGVSLTCRSCFAKFWRPLAQAVTNEPCPGCMRPLDRPFEASNLKFTYRLGEPLRRALENDSIYHVLVARWIAQTLALREDYLIGVYPGVIFRRGKEEVGEADILLLLADGALVPVEVKKSATSMTDHDEEMLTRIGEATRSETTIVATADTLADCPDQFKRLARADPPPPLRRLITADQWLDPEPRPSFAWTDDMRRYAEKEGAPPDPTPDQLDASFPDRVVRNLRERSAADLAARLLE